MLISDVHAAGSTVGMITKVENQAQVDGQPAAVGTPVHTNDTVSTGAKARLQVTFRDQTNLTLGENASVVIDRYVFDPDAGIGEATLNTTKGAFRLATGRLSEMTKKKHHRVVALRRDGRARHRLLVGTRSRAIWGAAGAQ